MNLETHFSVFSRSISWLRTIPTELYVLSWYTYKTKKIKIIHYYIECHVYYILYVTLKHHHGVMIFLNNLAYSIGWGFLAKILLQWILLSLNTSLLCSLYIIYPQLIVHTEEESGLGKMFVSTVFYHCIHHYSLRHSSHSLSEAPVSVEDGWCVATEVDSVSFYYMHVDLALRLKLNSCTLNRTTLRNPPSNAWRSSILKGQWDH